MTTHPKSGFRAATALVVALLAAGTAACGGSAHTNGASAPATKTATDKAAFCRADIAIDRAASTATSMDGYVTVLKDHSSDLAALRSDAPASIRSQAEVLVAAEEKAVSDNSADGLDAPAVSQAGSSVDTFCGVDGSGNPIPSYFGAGRGTAFCAVDAQINQGTATAGGPSQILSFLKSHGNLIDGFAADLSSLPPAQQTEARRLLDTTRAAISSNDPSAFGSATTIKDAGDLSLYCGQNE